MSTVTAAHSLFSRAATRYSAGASSLRLLKPTLLSFPFAPNSGKKTPRSLCYYVDPKNNDHPSNIPPFALVQPVMPSTPPSTTAEWKIKEDDKKVELTFFSMPDEAEAGDFQVAIEGDVLVVRTPPPPAEKSKWQPPHDVSFHVRLLVPELYDKKGVKARLGRRNLVVTIPKLPNLLDPPVSVIKVNVEKLDD